MTIQDLYVLKNIRATKKVILNQVETLNRFGEANAGIRKILAKALADLYEEEFKAEERLRDILKDVEDEEIRQIINLRFICGLPWVEVAAEVTPLEKDATHSAPLMKIRRFLRNKK